VSSIPLMFAGGGGRQQSAPLPAYSHHPCHNQGGRRQRQRPSLRRHRVPRGDPGEHADWGAHHLHQSCRHECGRH